MCRVLTRRYEVKFQNGQECGGAYIKLLSHEDKLDLVNRCCAVDFVFATCDSIKCSVIVCFVYVQF